MIVMNGVRIPLEEDCENAIDAACCKLGLNAADLPHKQIRRVSIDSRHATIMQVCSVVLDLGDPVDEAVLCRKFPEVSLYKKTEIEPVFGRTPMQHRPVVVGSGPAGLFAAYILAWYNYRPILIERGGDIDCRTAAVQRFNESGQLDPENNIQFGEGGAGTFSDGKLTSRINDALCDYVLETFVRHGAPDEIRYLAKPHIGSDLLGAIIKDMRKMILRKGGEVRFNTRLDDITARKGRMESVRCAGQELTADVVVLACGHSARDTYTLLKNRGLVFSPKPFSVGLRIEHLQHDIDRAQYGANAGNPYLPPAEYALATKVGARGVYTFCMCPGGSVVAAASQEGGVVTNGMSKYARRGKNANSAVAVSVDAKDLGGPFEAVDYQRALERTAFIFGGGNYRAPAQNVGSFLDGGKDLRVGPVEPTYARGVREADLGAILGDDISAALRAALKTFGQKIAGFDAPHAILTGIESRTSSPLRIERDNDSRQAIGFAGLYPCGEGAGYAGGIMSAAVDGIRTALEIMRVYNAKR